MIQDPAQLDRARRNWLEGLRQQHAIASGPDSALQLARGEWRCGEHADALAHFQLARELAPDWPEAHLALLNATSMLGRFEQHAAVLADALQRFPHEAMVQFHAARSELPSDLAGARRRLLPFAADPLLGQYVDALVAIEAGTALPDRGETEPHALARRDAFAWVRRQAPTVAVHAGHPTAVLLRALALAPAEGLTLECGVYFGRSLQIIAGGSDGIVHGFDSFQGLPEAWNEREGPGAYSTAGRLPAVAANVRLHQGWFEDTLPAFFAAHAGPIRLLHVDCDLYSSTRTVLEAATPRLVAGSIVVFDDLLAYPGYQAHELRAFEEFAARSGIAWELVAACLLGREVAIRIR